MSSGVTISDKTETDLLNAAGGTYDISELETKVDDSATNFYLNAYSSNNILWDASFKDNGTHGTSVKLSPATKINSGAFNSTDFYIYAPLVTSEANGVMSKEDKTKLDSIDTDALATKTELDGYLPLTGGILTGALDIQGQTNPDDNGEYYVGINSNGFVITKTANRSTRIIELGRNSASSGGLGYLDFYNSYGNINLRINPNGITLIDKTANDLLNGAGGTTTLKTINGESLLGSGDITTPTPTVNAASGTKTIWTGTQSEYEAVATKNANTLYFITED